MVNRNQNDITSKLQGVTDKTGYPIVQHKAQRRFGPPPGWKGPPPPKGCEVFIGKLPKNVFEDVLIPIFTKIGKIYDVRLMMTFSGSNRGYAFVKYTNRADAAAAVSALNNYEIVPGKHIKVVKSVENSRLFIGNIPKNKSKEEVFEELSNRVSDVRDLILYKNCFDERQYRGFAFVEFTTHRAAVKAKRALELGRVKLWDREVQVDLAKPEPDVDDDQMKLHLQKKPYTSSRTDKSIGSACAMESPCCSPIEYKPESPTDNYTMAPSKLESMCKRYTWAPPIYKYHKYVHPTYHDLWVCIVELPHVGHPLLNPPRALGPFITRACFSVQQAHVETAEIALHTLEMLRANLIQYQIHPHASTQMYQAVLQTIPNCIRVPYDYMNPHLYTRPPPPLIPVSNPGIW